MDREQIPVEAQDDKYSLFVPIEDHDLMKSVSVDENGDYIVQGVMTSDAQDEEDDSITPEGMDCSYFLEKGWIKYEHGNKPEQFIGEPMEVRVGRFEHPTLMKSVNGIFVKGRLFAARGMTKSAIEAMQDLQKSNTKRRMGWSIEGNVQRRDKATGKIVKSVLRNVVLTMNPVNTTTWAELAKSFAKDHELTIDMPDVEKSMDTAGAAAITRQSIDGYTPKKDAQQEWIDAFRSMVRKALVNKSFRDEFAHGVEEAEFLAFDWALEKGFDYEEAEGFAGYTAEKHPILKALVTNYGGETMSVQTEQTLADLFDTDLEELRKSLEAEEGDDVNEDDFEDEDEEEDIEKSAAVDEEGDEEGDEDADEAPQDDEDEEEDEDDEDAAPAVEKGQKTQLSKSLTENGQGQAFEVSDFLSSLTEEIGYSLDGMEKSLSGVTKNQRATVQALVSVGELVKGLASELNAKAQENVEIREEISELRKSLGEALNRPVGRKGVVNQREVQTLTKSVGATATAPTSRRQVEELLMKSFEAGEIPGSAITRFEAGTPIQNLNLPAHLQQTLGLSE